MQYSAKNIIAVFPSKKAPPVFLLKKNKKNKKSHQQKLMARLQLTVSRNVDYSEKIVNKTVITFYGVSHLFQFVRFFVTVIPGIEHPPVTNAVCHIFISYTRNSCRIAHFRKTSIRVFSPF